MSDDGSSRVVFLVDDDEPSRISIGLLIKSMGLEVQSYKSAEEFLAAYQVGHRGCLVTDLRMMGMSGLELLERIARLEFPLPTVVVTAYARTPHTVRAVKAGAVTVLEKPYKDDELWDAVRLALAEETRAYSVYQRRQEIRSRLARLTVDEGRVMEHILQGVPNKAIAQSYGISVRTVESRRRAIFSKMQAGSLPELVRMAIAVGSLAGS
jgi:FixJ family two-component response regulator